MTRNFGMYMNFEISYNSTRKIFIFKGFNSQEEFESFYSLEIPENPNTEIKQFEIYIFKRHQTIENKILQVWLQQEDELENIRVGWIFPIGALESVEHDFTENKHFLNYAKAAFIHLKMAL